MKLAKNTKVSFVELPGTDLHKYILVKRKGSTPVELTGITTMMKRMNLSAGYGHIAHDVLARAASRGTAIHEMFQSWEKEGTTNTTIVYDWECENGSHGREAEDLSAMFSKYSKLSAEHFKYVAVEYLVSDNESVASMIDFVSEVDENTVDLIDYKSSSTLDKKGLSWQLSFYKVLFEKQNPKIKVRNLIGVHCHDAKGLKLVSVPFMGEEAVEGALNTFRQYGESQPEESNLPATLTMNEFLPDYPGLPVALETKRQLQDAIKKIDAEFAEALDALKAKMRDEHITEVSVPGGRYVFTDEHTSLKFDQKRFQSAHPEEYEKYCSEGMVAASIKFYPTK